MSVLAALALWHGLLNLAAGSGETSNSAEEERAQLGSLESAHRDFVTRGRAPDQSTRVFSNFLGTSEPMCSFIPSPHVRRLRVEWRLARCATPSCTCQAKLLRCDAQHLTTAPRISGHGNALLQRASFGNMLWLCERERSHHSVNAQRVLIRDICLRLCQISSFKVNSCSLASSFKKWSKH